HVTLRAVAGLPSLRTDAVYEMIRSILLGQSKKSYATDFHVAEFSVQDNHLHMICEGTADGIRRGISGFMIAFARRFNAMHGRRGKVWGDRYHTTELDSPTQV